MNIEDLKDKKLDYLPSEIINFLQFQQIINKDCDKGVFPQNIKLPKKISEKKEKFLKSGYLDISTVRGEEIKKINVSNDKASISTLIPTNYFITEEDSKLHLQYKDHEPETTEESEKKLILFPTEFPQSREEVLYLNNLLDKMLSFQNYPDLKLDNYCVTKEDDINHMITLINQLDNIYNIVFHELGRQITISYDARGFAVFELREKYMNLIGKVPEELLKLREDVRNQCVEDKNLLLEIENFQSCIKILTNQLKEVKMRDIKLTENAEKIHKELEEALHESARSKDLLDEYHILYDLQKQRLESHMSVINNEKEEWSSLAFALSLKISDESLLNTIKRLRLVTKKLFQLSQHFAIYISDRDTVITGIIQDLSGKCLKQITKVHTETIKILNNFHDLFGFLKEKVDSLSKWNLKDSVSQLEMVKKDLNSFKEFLDNDTNRIVSIDNFNVEYFSSMNESINLLITQIKVNIKTISQRKPIDFENDVEKLVNLPALFETIEKWTEEFSNRISLIKMFEPFIVDLNSFIAKIESEIEQLSLKHGSAWSLDDDELIFSLISDLRLEILGNIEFNNISKIEDFSEFNKFYNATQKTLVTLSGTIDLFDAQLMTGINGQQSKVTNWIIDALFLVSNMHNMDKLEIQYQNFRESFETLVSVNNSICRYVIEWTRALKENSGENKIIEIDEYVEENEMWINVAKILIQNIGEKIEKELVKRKESEKQFQQMTLENIYDFVDDIINKTTDENIFLAIDAVKFLKKEIDETLTRTKTANDKKVILADTLQEIREKTIEMENNISQITVKYRDMMTGD